KTMDHYTIKALWIYWIKGDDEVELTDKESTDDKDEVAEIYEWNKDVPWIDDKPWTKAGVWTKPTPVKHTCKPFNYKTGCSRNGQHVVGWMMDTVMEETYPELTLLETNYITKTLNDMRLWKIVNLKIRL
ncbi:hypothetical protein Tco_0301837, partial [Tanacetum coccineum]